ncbi:hypothetical protein ACFVFQ_27235 [Streptomyces sp. NPDC057743]|uniref:hypothetical protein n=1 Tax=Streptomyces sp. NPDC057743 TaxID=3346236 RepID=UPI0036BAB747
MHRLRPTGPRPQRPGRATDVGDLYEVLEFLDQAGCSRRVITDVAREGALYAGTLSLPQSLATVAATVQA